MYTQAQDKVLQEKKSNMTKLDEERTALAEEKKELLATIDQQEFSPAEVTRMTQQKIALQESLQSLSDQKSEEDKEAWELEMKITRLLEDIET